MRDNRDAYQKRRSVIFRMIVQPKAQKTNVDFAGENKSLRRQVLSKSGCWGLHDALLLNARKFRVITKPRR